MPLMLVDGDMGTGSRSGSNFAHLIFFGNMLFCKGVYFFLGVPSVGIYALNQPVQGHPMLFTTSHLLHEVPE